MHIDPARIWKTDTPGYVVVLDAECRYDHQVHGRYLAAERCTPAEIADLHPPDRRHDPRATPRWPCQRGVALSWLVLTDGNEGLRPIRMETRGWPEQDEAGIIAAFLDDMAQLGRVQLTSWGGFHADLPQILLAATAAGLRLPSSLPAFFLPDPDETEAGLIRVAKATWKRWAEQHAAWADHDHPARVALRALADRAASDVDA